MRTSVRVVNLFDKWEKRELSESEAKELVAQGKAKDLKFIGEGKATVKVKAEKGAKTARQKEPIVEVKIDEAPKRIEYQIEKPTGNISIIVKKGKINKRKKYKDYDKRRYFPNHILREDIGDEKKAKYRYFYRWNYYWSESLENMADIIPKHSPELENIAMNDMMLDLKKALGVIAAFVMTREVAFLLGFTFLVSAPIGLPVIQNMHLYPPTIVHWVTRR